MTSPSNKDGRHSRTSFNIGPYGKCIEKYFHMEPLAQLEPNFNEMVFR